MPKISSLLWGINTSVEAAYHYFHAINIRVRQNLTCEEIRFLRQNADFVTVRRGNYIRGYSMGVLTVVNPKQPALDFMAEYPSAMVNRLEIAVDLICDANTKHYLRDLFDKHFVQPWHSRQVQIRFDGGTYSRRYGQRQYVWYHDRPSKVTGEVDCFHLEARHWGVEAVRRVGIQHPGDLLTFDHDKYSGQASKVV